MSILPDAAARGKPSNRATRHDALVCGLGYATDCPDCREAYRQRHPESPTDRAWRQWDALRAHYSRLLGRSVDWSGGYPQRPQPLAPEELGRLAWTLLSPEHRPLIRELLLDLLGDEIADIARAVAEEVRR
jgi:hypothetical protein